MTYTQMLFALTFDKIVFGTTPKPLSIIGSSLILGSAIYVAVQKEQGKVKDEAVDTSRHRDEERGLVEGMDDEDDEDDHDRPLQEVQLRTLR
jgi:hypothetical protein